MGRLSTFFFNANLLRGGREDLTYGFYGSFSNKKYRFTEFLEVLWEVLGGLIPIYIFNRLGV
jgi:hypothetical protein